VGSLAMIVATMLALLSIKYQGDEVFHAEGLINAVTGQSDFGLIVSVQLQDELSLSNVYP
jgi:hypothetical protein